MAIYSEDEDPNVEQWEKDKDVRILTSSEISMIYCNIILHTWMVESDDHNIKLDGTYELTLKSSNGRFEVSVILNGCDSQPCIQSAITDKILQGCLSSISGLGYKFDTIIPLGHSTNEMREFIKTL
jgi:hypothetical protein